MKRSSRVVADAMSLLGALLAASLSAEEPAKKAAAVKPPWQRLLQGEDAKRASEQEKKLAQLQEAEKLAEALEVAVALAELRAKAQGADHWQAIDAHFQVEAIRRVLKAKKEEQQSFRRAFRLQQEADKFAGKGRYHEAQLLLEQVLATCRKVLGENHPDTARIYTNLASILDAQGKYPEAEEGHRRALALFRNLLGEEHPDTAVGYGNQASLLNAQGKYPEAEEGHRRALTIHRKVMGEEHAHTASSYGKLALDLNAQGKYREAEENYRKALAISCKVLGEEHRDTATCYNNLAANQQAQGKYREAEEGFRKAMAISRKVLGEENLSLATSYNNLAAVLCAQGKYREAEEDYRKALTIRRQMLGEEHLRTATCYMNLAANLDAQGKYREAEEGYRKALAIKRKALGEEHVETFICYNNLAANLRDQGRYQEAEESCRKGLALCRKLLGEEHPHTAFAYNNLASNQKAQGKYQAAEEGYRKALTIRLKVLSQDDPQMATSYNNVASILNTQGKYQEAEEGYRKALAIKRKSLSEEHPDIALYYSNLAQNEQAQGKYREAEEGYRKALTIKRKVLGEEHPDTALGYDYVAWNLDAQGKYPDAEQGHRKALAITRMLLGEGHPQTAGSYHNLANNLYAQGKYQEAEKLWQSASDSFAHARLHLAASGLERATFTSERSPLHASAAVLARNGKPSDAWRRFEESLARGIWDDLTSRLRRPQAERDTQEQITARIDRLQKLIERVSVVKPTPEQAKQREELLSQLRRSYDDLTIVAQQLEKQYGPIAGQIFSLDKLQASLPADAALLGWLDIAGLPKAADPNGEHWAVLLRSSGDPIWVRLYGSGDNNAWTNADTQLPGQLRAALQSSSSKWQALAERLRQQRLQPLAQHLNGVGHLIVLPSTALAGVPVEVIADGYTVSYAHSGTMYAHLRQQPTPTGKGLFALADPIFEASALAEKPQPLPPGGVLLTMVAPGSNAFRAGLKPNDVLLRYSETDLAGPADFKPLPEAPNSDKTVPVIVWRDGQTRKQPLYVRPGNLGVVIAQEPAPHALAEQRRLDRLFASRSGDDGKWDRLPGTRVEVAALQQLFSSEPSRVLLDFAASEQQLNEMAKTGELSKYRYIHLATHGEVNDTFPLRSAVILSRDRLPDDNQRTELLVSGQPIPDGRLTAEEVLRSWNLNADLVTLSACQTALGKYERGEGFVGFAQALVLSGSRSVCLSLWKVNDTATALLMERFYQNLLGNRDGLDKPMAKGAALAEAKTWLRNLPRAEAVKRAASLSSGVDRGKHSEPPRLEVSAAPRPDAAAKSDRPYAHPYYWAAFVLVGHAD